MGGDAWARLGVVGFPSDAGASGGIPTGFWWWWRATRVVPDAISEFPAFSLVLGDLHAHVLALPLAILAVAIALDGLRGLATTDAARLAAAAGRAGRRGARSSPASR